MSTCFTSREESKCLTPIFPRASLNRNSMERKGLSEHMFYFSCIILLHFHRGMGCSKGSARHLNRMALGICSFNCLKIIQKNASGVTLFYNVLHV